MRHSRSARLAPTARCSLFACTLSGALLCASTMAFAQEPPPVEPEPPAAPAPGPRVRAEGRISAERAAPRPRRLERREVYGPGADGYVPNPDQRPSDHDAFVGHFGVGFFGVLSLPIMGCAGGALCTPQTDASLPAPSIGVRYWWQDTLGLEAALGIFIADNGDPGVDRSRFGLALHAGLPFVLARSGHFSFELVPQLNVGVASGSYQSTAPGAPEFGVSGFLLELGAKVGAELHFGFIDIPQLSLQGTLGLMLRHEARSVDQSGVAGSVDQHETSLATFVDQPPWALFTGALTAIYYY